MNKPEPEINADVFLTAESLMADSRRLAERPCAGCGAVVCHHARLMSFSLGFKEVPRCLACLASALGRPIEALADQIYDYVQHRECYCGAWEMASREEGTSATGIPPCLGVPPKQETPPV